MEIIKIMNAALTPCQADGEYQWAESSECAYGRSWEGDVRGYLENALLEGHDPEEVAAMMSGDYEGSIHDLPEGASALVGAHGEPTAIYWPEELTEEERLREEEEGGPLAEQDDPADWAQSEN